ncbi:MAG TPA: type II CAAX endopeptidase family protein [Gaiellaceae bacterium]|nr:type II CAAX endopeptidase family protein [Gaiellaceae bacterium]
MNERVLQRKLVWWWVLVGAIAVFSFAGQATSDDAPNREAFYRYDTVVVGTILYLLLVSFALLIATGLNLRDAFALRRPASWRRAALIALGAFVTMWIVAGILEQIFHAGEEQGLDPRQLSVDVLPPFLLNLVLAAIFVPVVEELIYRGIGFTLLVQFGDLAAIALTAFMFALAHGILDGIPVFFVIGTALAFVRSRTKSIYPCMLMHGLFNGVQVILGAAT